MASNSATYCLMLHNGRRQEPETLEFTAPSVATALSLAKEVCGRRPVEFYENGRRLGTLNLRDDEDS